MWFWLSLAALLCWSGSDLFSKIGCRRETDKYSHLKMLTAVGIVMGIHALYEIFIRGVEISMDIIWQYLPVALLYIVSMMLGYISLRYIELSISSPICNASGVVVAIMMVFTMIFKGERIEGIDIGGIIAIVIAIACIGGGVVSLGFVEAHEDEELRAKRQMIGNRKYAKSALAFILPIAYCILDSLGTFFDTAVIGKITDNLAMRDASGDLAGVFANGVPENIDSLSEQAQAFATTMSDNASSSANVAYELTFLLIGIAALIFLLIKKQPYIAKEEGAKFTGAIFETVGQFAYIKAIADEKTLMFAAPIISSYCVASMIWSRIFLKERLSWKHYISIATVIVGIIILGVMDL